MSTPPEAPATGPVTVNEPSDEVAWWRGPLVPLDQRSSDSRVLFTPEGGPRVRPMPLCFRWVEQDWGRHDGAYQVGTIDRLWTQEYEGARWIYGEGRIDMLDPKAADVARKIKAGYAGWNSIDGDDVDEYEMRTTYMVGSREIPDPTPEEAEAFGDLPREERPRQTEVYDDWRLAASTLVQIPAFEKARVEIVEGPLAGLPDDAEVIGVNDKLPAYTSEVAVAAAASGELDLPMVDIGYEWDPEGARQRVDEMFGLTAPDVAPAEGEGAPPAEDGAATPDYEGASAAFFWADGEGAFAYQFADVIDGELKIVPFAVVQAAEEVATLDEENDAPEVRSRVEAVYERMRAEYPDMELNLPWDVIEEEESAPSVEDPVVAAGGPLAAPLDWFKNPNFTQYMPLTLTDDGRVYGHVAPFRKAHASFPGRQVFAPEGAKMDRFLCHAYRTAEGDDIAVGNIAMDINHALTPAETGRSVPPGEAIEHYDKYANTRCKAAIVNAGEDQFGVWVAGTLRPGLSEEEIVNFRASTPSGDWRNIGGDMHFIAVIATNFPGLAPNRKTVMGDGQVYALVASGQPQPESVAPSDVERLFGSPERMRALAVMFAEESARLAREEAERKSAAEEQARRDAALAAERERALAAAGRVRKLGAVLAVDRVRRTKVGL